MLVILFHNTMPRGRSWSCFNVSSHSSTTFTYNTAYSNIGQLLAEQEIKKADGMKSKPENVMRPRQTSAGLCRPRPHSDGDVGNNRMEKILKLYPWYHSNTDRQTAEAMVLGSNNDAPNGTFMVRKSGTRSGQHVITFNNNSQPTHLQITFDYSGRCRVKSQWFKTIFDMLEHFRVHLIPVESARHSQITLTGYVSNLEIADHNIK